MLKLVNQRVQEEEISLPSQSIDEILGTQQDVPTKVTPVPIANNDAISNSSSPIENEKLQKMKEEQENADKIEIQVEFTEEQQCQQESLQFGACKGPTKGIGYGQNSFKNQAELIEMKKLQGQQGVQRQKNSQEDLLDLLLIQDSQPACKSLQSSAQKKKPVQSSIATFFAKKSSPPPITEVKTDQLIKNISDFRQYEDYCVKNSLSPKKLTNPEESAKPKKGRPPKNAKK